MHELTIARRLIDRASTAADDAELSRVETVTVTIGEATHLVPDQLAFCLDAMADGTPLSDATVEFERISPAGVCSCGWEGELPTLESVRGVSDRRCPDCGSAVELTAGRECRVTAIDGPTTTQP